MQRLTVNISLAGRSVVARSPAQFALTLPDLVLLVLEELPNLGLVARHRRVCTVWDRSARCILARSKKIDNFLRPYFADVPAFRRLLCDYDGFISGSFALSFFRPYDMDGKPTRGPDSDMDLYFEWCYVDEVGERLVAEGYTLVGEWTNDDVGAGTAPASIPDDSFESVQRFERGTLHIDLVLTSATPVYCLFSFHSTCVMNFITWNAAYCMFARDTLLYSIALVLRINNDRTRRAIDKYSERGFKMLQWLEGTYEYARRFFRRTKRWVGDRDCWTVRFEEESVLYGTDPDTGLQVELAVPPTYDWTMNGFCMEYVQVFGPTWALIPDAWLWMPVQDCIVIQHPSLVYSYAADPEFWDQFFRYLRRRALAEGAFWATQHIRVDNMLPTLKRDRVYCDRVRGARPHPLYG